MAGEVLSPRCSWPAPDVGGAHRIEKLAVVCEGNAGEHEGKDCGCGASTVYLECAAQMKGDGWRCQYSHVVHRKEIISDQDPLDHERLHQSAAVMLSILPEDIGPQKPLCAMCQGGG